MEIKETKSPDKYISFKLGTHSLVVPLLEIHEVLAYRTPKKTPNMDEHFLGVLNVRGRLMGVYDCRRRLGGQGTIQSQAALLSCETTQGTLALLVDEVEAVVAIHDTSIQAQKHAPQGIDLRYVLGTVEIEKRLYGIFSLKSYLSELALTRIENERKSDLCAS